LENILRTYTNRKYLDALKNKVIVFDGAMGTNIQLQKLTAEHYGGEKYEGCNDILVKTYPQAVEKVHRDFLEAGVDVIETCTFRSNRITLKEYDLENITFEINEMAAKLAKRAADAYSTPEQPRYVAGSMGPTGKLPSMDDPELSDIRFDELVSVFQEQASGLILGGVDLLLIETSQDILEVKAAITGIRQAFDENGIYLPIQAQVTLDTNGYMLMGTDVSAALTILEGLPIDIIGVNCSTGPEHMQKSIEFLSNNTRLPISCIPNAGLPLNIDGEAVYPMKPAPFAEALTQFAEKYHINVVGGCCGTRPAHLAELAARVKHIHPDERDDNRKPNLASGTLSVSMQQQPAPFLIGERLNTQGSRKFKRLMLAEDYDSILTIANHQVESGAHGLDICVALTERDDEPELIRKVIKKISPAVNVPLIIDSTELGVMEEALQTAPGKCLLNSTHLESGRKKFEPVMALAKKYNAAVLVLTIDENGMAKTLDRKLEIAKRIYDIAIREYDFYPGDIVFDPLTFTLATGEEEYQESAVHTLEAIKQIKQTCPGVLTSLGLSNVSFGLKSAARQAINSVMLYHAVQYGLDMAIVNPAGIKPYTEISAEERNLIENLIFNRDPNALSEVIKFYEDKTIDPEQNQSQKAVEMAKLSPGDRLYWRILHREKDGIEADIDLLLQQAALEERQKTAVSVLNKHLLPAMKEVGEKFGSGELILPFVLQSAEAMKKAVNQLETYLDRNSAVSKGTIILATVYGDVHDIGKNLVKTILVNNGYKVIDLGKQVPAEKIIQTAIDEKADAIGLSALLVSTSQQMPLIVSELHRANLCIPVMIGGAAINDNFAENIAKVSDKEKYSAGVFYCKDAFDALQVMEKIISE
jgi:5-methyltetrahydrofolate--homocysteine methyltransferase